MSEYTAPLREMRFVLNEWAHLDEVSALPGFEEATPDRAEAGSGTVISTGGMTSDTRLATSQSSA